MLKGPERSLRDQSMIFTLHVHYFREPKVVQ